MKSGKNIVICLDGTGNHFKEDLSNVVKLYRVLKRDPEKQIAYYDPGVGTLADPGFKTSGGKKINKAMGLAFGKGLTRNLEEAYTYLMDNYLEGDRIYIFGFSRGAYTARALAAFIHACGILEKGCHNLIPYATKLFKIKSKNDFKIQARFRSTYSRVSNIALLGLWDTVSTFGWIYDPIFFPYTTNNKSVEAVRHAISLDERRAFFGYMPWGDKFRDSQDVKEVWFAGVHSDVGGSYPEVESGLAKISLNWMVEESNGLGLLIDEKKYERYVLGLEKNGKPSKDYVGPDAGAPIHESLKGPWWAVQRLPMRVWNPEKEKKSLSFPPRRRQVPEGAVLHASVLERMEKHGYQPPALNPEKRKPYPSVEEIRERFGIYGGA